MTDLPNLWTINIETPCPDTFNYVQSKADEQLAMNRTKLKIINNWMYVL